MRSTYEVEPGDYYKFVALNTYIAKIICSLAPKYSDTFKYTPSNTLHPKVGSLSEWILGLLYVTFWYNFFLFTPVKGNQKLHLQLIHLKNQGPLSTNEKELILANCL